MNRILYPNPTAKIWLNGLENSRGSRLAQMNPYSLHLSNWSIQTLGINNQDLAGQAKDLGSLIHKNLIFYYP